MKGGIYCLSNVPGGNKVRSVKNLGNSCTTTPFKEKVVKEIEDGKMMMIVGQVSSAEEAKEIEYITKSFVVGKRARALALQIRKL
jgi:hypothetical protein